MRVLILLFASSGLLHLAMAEAPSDSVDFRLDAHLWEHRLLLVFAPPDAGETVEGQKEAFDGQEAGFRDRDLLLVTVGTEGQGRLRETPGASGRPLTNASIRRLYDRFDIPSDSFRVVLVGKDGTEKRRNTEPVTARSVFDTIDAMPMRQREMRDSSDEGR